VRADVCQGEPKRNVRGCDLFVEQPGEFLRPSLTPRRSMRLSPLRIECPQCARGSSQLRQPVSQRPGQRPDETHDAIFRLPRERCSQASKTESPERSLRLLGRKFTQLAEDARRQRREAQARPKSQLAPDAPTPPFRKPLGRRVRPNTDRAFGFDELEEVESARWRQRVDGPQPQ